MSVNPEPQEYIRLSNSDMYVEEQDIPPYVPIEHKKEDSSWLFSRYNGQKIKIVVCIIACLMFIAFVLGLFAFLMWYYK